ncbi:hypothetical protein JL722_14103 [Aureococcus anophagefferens]|nr:hypothetical protein JL722_14103 [Aureococcus anophagefferens]
MDSDDDFGGPNSDDGENFEDEGFGGFDDEDQPAATQHYDLPDDVADEFNDEAEDGAVLVMNGEADEGPAVEEWDWKSRLAPLEEDAPAAAAAEEDEDDGAWRDEDDYGNPTEEKKVSLKREARELQCTVDRRLEKKHGGAPAELAADADAAAADDAAAPDRDAAMADARRFDGQLWVDNGPPPPPRAPVYQSYGGGSGGRGGGGSSSGGNPYRDAMRSSSGGRRLDAPRRLNARNGEGYKKRPTNCVTVAMGRGGGRGSPGGRGGGFKGGKGTGKGAPGTGKTTLAHVLAEAAGYRVRELNASDERSRTPWRPRRRFVAKPACLVLDELDGADGKAAINAIVAMAKAPLPAKSEPKAAKRRSSAFFGGDNGDGGARQKRAAPARRR